MTTAKRSQPGGKETQPAELHCNPPEGSQPGNERFRTRFHYLSPREIEVLKSLAEGSKPMEIARELDINVKTVYTYRERIRSKLGLRDDRDLTAFARENGLI